MPKLKVDLEPGRKHSACLSRLNPIGASLARHGEGARAPPHRQAPDPASTAFPTAISVPRYRDGRPAPSGQRADPSGRRSGSLPSAQLVSSSSTLHSLRWIPKRLRWVQVRFPTHGSRTPDPCPSRSVLMMGTRALPTRSAASPNHCQSATYLERGKIQSSLWPGNGRGKSPPPSGARHNSPHRPKDCANGSLGRIFHTTSGALD